MKTRLFFAALGFSLLAVRFEFISAAVLIAASLTWLLAEKSTGRNFSEKLIDHNYVLSPVPETLNSLSRSRRFLHAFLLAVAAYGR